MLNSNEKQEISRYDLKKQLEGLQSFDISAFGQSKNQSSANLKGLLHSNNNQSLFPTVDAPTLQLLQDSQYNIRYLDLGKDIKGNQKPKRKTQTRRNEYYEDLTARNNQTQGVYQYEQKLQEMTRQLQGTLQKLERERKQNKILHEKIGLMEIHEKKTVQQLKQRLKQQREQIKILKQREIKSARQKQLLQKQISQYRLKYGNMSGNMKQSKQYRQDQSRQSRALSLTGNSIHSSVLMTSYLQDKSIFCAQLLSPQETVSLLSKLLKKVSKSSKMIKELTQDHNIKKILAKMQNK